MNSLKSFEEIAKLWLQSDIFGKQYSYRNGLRKDVAYLVKYFGKKQCDDIKGMDVDKFDALKASKLKGHSNVQITLDIYTHLDQKYKRIDIAQFNNYVRNDVANIVLPIMNIV